MYLAHLTFLEYLASIHAYLFVANEDNIQKPGIVTFVAGFEGTGIREQNYEQPYNYLSNIRFFKEKLEQRIDNGDLVSRFKKTKTYTPF